MRRRDISILCRIALSKTLWRDVYLYSTVLWNPPASAGRWTLLILALTMSNARWRHQAACDRFSYSNDVSIVINLWHNNRHGCSCCTHEGKVVQQGSGFSCICPFELTVLPLGIVQQTVRSAAIATQTAQAENYVKTESDLLFLQSFIIVDSFPEH